MNTEPLHPIEPADSNALAEKLETRARLVLARAVETSDSLEPTILRIALGAVILPHALQKTLGLFSGGGFLTTMDAFVNQLHIPPLLALLAIVTEQVSSLALLFGFFTRVAALGIAAVMIGAIVTVHYPNGFFMNWYGAQAGEGYEYHLLVLAMTAVLFMLGGGRASVDRALDQRR